MAEYFRDGILKDGASRYPALELAARPSSAVPFAARGAGGSAPQEADTQQSHNERPAKPCMKLDARSKGSTGRLPQEQQPPAGR